MIDQQECIPVGYVPPAAVAVMGGGSQHTPGSRPPLGANPPIAGTLQVWAWRPPQVWTWRSPFGVSLETCKACWDTIPPQDLLQGMLGYHLKCILGYHTPHPHEQNHRHIEKHNLAPTSLRVVNRLSVLPPANRREKIYKK